MTLSLSHQVGSSIFSSSLLVRCSNSLRVGLGMELVSEWFWQGREPPHNSPQSISPSRKKVSGQFPLRMPWPTGSLRYDEHTSQKSIHRLRLLIQGPDSLKKRGCKYPAETNCAIS
ncbi:hypothetical protein BO86DRAFT_31025 [Aspergillus japonicus CBS 114.51]|uniref:Uncharacterized protein n=1 Tax=Aspergillus japonicus CBS 114.51 TaxID=1448312 RepID=A0A8T8X882_ASPJA|nr:hypothetical protein BO86DRAFT_31025 [Aspergillus japonicus CBS 114.51]RAH83649.1 hypothetical protein BO86DRAFT_31025 [Aspergillus japonicus CBS 114.51]